MSSPPLQTRAIKHDEYKPPLSMIPRSALVAEATVMGFGAAKYGRDNWRKGMEWTRLIDAALRHITAFNEGEDYDSESNISHLAHARCCLAFLTEYQAKGLGTDDRPTTQPPYLKRDGDEALAPQAGTELPKP